MSSDFFTETGINAATFDPYITGFRYIGTTAGSGGSSSTAGTVIQSFVCDETIAAGDVVRLVTSADSPGFTNPGRVVKAIATTTADQTYEAIGVANEAGNSGNTIDVVFNGARNLTFAVAPTTAQIGKPIYLSSSTAGRPTLTAPTASSTAVVKIGKILAANGSDTSVKCKIDVELIAIIA